MLLDIDREYKEASQWREISMAGARLLLEDFRIGEIIARAWSERNPAIAFGLDRQLDQIDALTTTLSASLRKRGVEKIVDHQSVIQQKRITGDLRQMVALADEQLTDATIQKLLETRKKLALDLGATFAELHVLLKSTESTITRSQTRQEQLAKLQLHFLLYSLPITILVGVGITLYYRRNFIKPIDCMLDNIDLMTRNCDLHPPLSGDDEIARFDKAFREMQRQLVLIAERERALFDNSTDVICVFDDEQRFVRLNQACLGMWNYPASQLEYEDLAAIAKGQNLQKLRESFDSSHCDEESVNVEVELEKNGGGTVSTLWSITWSGKHRMWYCTVHDISERKRIEELREKFLGLIARDCQIPLRRISELYGYLESGKYGLLTDEARAKCRMTLNTLSRVTSLVGKLSDSHEVSYSPERIDVTVQSVIEAARQDVDGLSLKHKVAVLVDCSAELRFNVDQESMTRVMVNLLSNAIKFSAENTVVAVVAREKDKLVEILVRDTGRGIPGESLAKLFQPFSQVEAADGKRGKGTGLGLVTVKMIVEKHGGKIDVDSALAKGTTFTITLPRISSQSSLDEIRGREFASDRGQASSASRTEYEAGRAPLMTAVDRIGLKGKALLLTGVPTVLGIAYISLLLTVVIDANHKLSQEINERKLSSAAKRLTFAFYDIALRVKLADALKTSSSAIRDSVNALPASIKQFNRLARANAAAKVMAADIVKVATERQSVLKSFVQNNIADTTLDARRLFELEAISWSHANSVRQSMQSFLSTCESREHVIPEKLRASRSLQFQLLFLALAGNLALSSWLAIYFGNSLSRRLSVLAENSRRFSAGETLQQRLSGSDEIARLDGKFHEMAETIEVEREKESAFLNNSRSLICSVDDNLLFTACNTAVTPMFGLLPSSLYSISIVNLLAQDDGLRFETALQSARQSQQPAHIETVTKSDDDSLLYLSWSLAWSQREQGFFCIAHDVTAQKELQRLRREFIAMVSHDLRSPLTTVLSVTSLLSFGVFGELPPAACPVIESVSAETEGVLKVLNDLLDVEKIDAGQMRLSLEPVQLGRMLSEVVDAFHNIALLPGDSHIIISADEERLKLTFSDLLSAAQAAVPQSTLVQLFSDSGSHRIDLVLSDIGSSEPARLLVDLCNENDIATQCERVETLSVVSPLNIELARRVIESHGGTLSAELKDRTLVITVSLSCRTKT